MVGDFTVVVNGAGAVVAAVFGDQTALPPFPLNISVKCDEEQTAEARTQLCAYFVGKRDGFDLQLAPEGSPFQHRVWAALREIPFGETRSYGDLADLLGSSPRAVGRANATNPICVIVPCHRVIGADGTLTGYAGGMENKRWLLELEGALAACLL
jgi:methylated-DNA-[protein]-cysteine S-methyltransferase